ncbi:MAG: type IV pilus biogenesis/stability protein PilW [Cellvibrionaceae bacterium]|nr:type IV pilus biogenesis/stability protein PilW [Cellvibrionaceae bacterium]
MWVRLVKSIFRRCALVVGLCLTLAACVTTTNAPEQRIDLAKAEATHIQAGLNYLRQRDKESARRHFLKALKLNSQSAGANNGIALVHQMEEEYELADQYYRKALSLDPDYALARNNYGVFLFRQERYKEAEEHLEIVAKDFTYGRRTIALISLGKTQLKLNKTTEAEKSFKQVLSINFRQPQAQLELADLYFQQKSYTNSKFYLDQFAKYSRQTPRSLWIGIRIERVFGNKDKEASYALALKNLHPYSQEYLEYKQSAE